jgi:ferritin-like metal-binding protein YciE
VHCHAMEGMRQELHEALAANPSPMVLEGLILASSSKIEHTEIAAYTGLLEMANAMGMGEVADLLTKNLKQEREMLEKVQMATTQMTQQMASGMSGGMGMGQQSGLSGGMQG